MNKMNENHPDENLLMSYLELPDSEEVRNVRRHIISCVSCRELLANVQSIIGTLKVRPLTEAYVAGADHPEEEDISKLVDGRFTSDQKNRIKAHIDACSLCTKRMLHYALHSAELRKAMSEETVDEAVISNRVADEASSKDVLHGVFSEHSRMDQKDTSADTASHPSGARNDRSSGQPFFRRIFSWRMPVWLGVPATALATAILVFVLFSQGHQDVEQQASTAQQEQTKIVLAYQEKQEITISPMTGKTPGIGFFSQSRGETRPFKGLTVRRISGNQYRVSWPPVEGVVAYDIRVFTSGPTEKQTFVTKVMDVRDTSIIMDLSSLIPGETYVWDLTGHMEDGRMFMTKGGFVVANFP